MPKVLRPIGHEDRLSIVDHLDELRRRLFVCLAVLVVAFGLCFWQNNVLLNLLNQPLPPPEPVGGQPVGGLTRDSVGASRGISQRRRAVQRAVAVIRPLGLRPRPDSPARRATSRGRQGPSAEVAQEPPDHHRPRRALHHHADRVPSTAALLLTLPVLLYEIFAFCVPALSPSERQGGDARGRRRSGAVRDRRRLHLHRSCMPPAVKFLQGYNSNQFDNLVQAKPLYSFEV